MVIVSIHVGGACDVQHHWSLPLAISTTPLCCLNARSLRRIHKKLNMIGCPNRSKSCHQVLDIISPRLRFEVFLLFTLGILWPCLSHNTCFGSVSHSSIRSWVFAGYIHDFWSSLIQPKHSLFLSTSLEASVCQDGTIPWLGEQIRGTAGSRQVPQVRRALVYLGSCWHVARITFCWHQGNPRHFLPGIKNVSN